MCNVRLEVWNYGVTEALDEDGHRIQAEGKVQAGEK